MQNATAKQNQSPGPKSPQGRIYKPDPRKDRILPAVGAFQQEIPGKH